LELSSSLQVEVLTDVIEGLKDLMVDDPKEAVARKQTEDREHVKKLSQDLQGMEDVESSSLVTSSIRIKKGSDALDSRPEGEDTGNIAYTEGEKNTTRGG
jgi:hypothetical protein